MDANQFDALSRSLVAAGSSRRQVVAVAGGLLTTIGLNRAAAEADGKKKGGKRKGKKKKKKNNPPPPPRCAEGSAPCGSGCCAGDLLHYCCGGKSCCTFEQGCSSNGLCTICNEPADPCLKANCNDEGNLDPPFVPRCTGDETCYVITKPGLKPYGTCKGPCPDEYSICKQSDGTPVCCHTNPSSGTPVTCEQCVGGV